MRALLILASCAMPLPALAQDMRGDLFPSDTGCYQRTYTTVHMATHPEQTVRQITIFPDLAKTSKAALALHVQLMLRGGADLYRDVAYCVDQGTGLVCDVPFDSGAFTLRPSDGALQLNVGPSGLIIEDSGGNGLVELSGTTGDDRVFRLMPVPQNGCF